MASSPDEQAALEVRDPIPNSCGIGTFLEAARPSENTQARCPNRAAWVRGHHNGNGRCIRTWRSRPRWRRNRRRILSLRACCDIGNGTELGRHSRRRNGALFCSTWKLNMRNLRLPVSKAKRRNGKRRRLSRKLHIEDREIDVVALQIRKHGAERCGIPFEAQLRFYLPEGQESTHVPDT